MQQQEQIQQQEQQHTLFVCTTCASMWQNGKRIGKSGGEQLLEQLQKLHETWELKEQFPLKGVECMSACSHFCTVSFAADGKYTYLFGDLSVNSEQIQETSIAVLNCASKYFSTSDGLLPWAERPELLKKGLLAKIPPVPM